MREFTFFFFFAELVKKKKCCTVKLYMELQQYCDVNMLYMGNDKKENMVVKSFLNKFVTSLKSQVRRGKRSSGSFYIVSS